MVETIIETISRRNTSTVEIKLRELNLEIFNQHARIDSLQNALSSMSERMNALELMLLQQKAKSMGTGASVI
jgi:hypothetical protein